MSSDVDDVDPQHATTVSEFALCLRRLRTRAGNPSYRALQRWGERHQTPLPRSTVVDALAGKRLPRKELVVAYARACGVDATVDRRWEIAWNRLADSIRNPPPSQGGLAGRLSDNLQTAGLLRIGTNYFNELEWKQLFAEVQELDIVVAYGQTWQHMHAHELAKVAARPTSRIRVFLAEPDDELTVTVLADRFGTTTEEIRTRIENTRREYEALRRPQGAALDIYYRPGDRVFSFFRFDDVAIVGLYSHSRRRSTPVPVFVCSRPGELFDFVHEELDVILSESRRA